MNKIEYRPIGIIHTPFKEVKGTPIQPAGAKDIEGVVEVFPQFADGLIDIEGFSHIILIYHFHLVGTSRLKAKPYMDEKDHGVFAMRGPSRPNPIGFSVVHLIKVEGNKLHVRDVDIIDGTPLLDIKPYVPEFDVKAVQKIGWLKGRIQKLSTSRDNGRFIE
jgi:tRNA-Thr(GGU) m(6)t(6)A37 methyltransferase TsaA